MTGAFQQESRIGPDGIPLLPSAPSEQVEPGRLTSAATDVGLFVLHDADFVGRPDRASSAPSRAGKRGCTPLPTPGAARSSSPSPLWTQANRAMVPNGPLARRFSCTARTRVSAREV